MIAQISFSILLAGVLVYACSEYRRAPVISILSILVATAGLYFVWLPSHATRLATLVGIGRGVDLIIYVWVVISLILLLNLHLKLRSQAELITILERLRSPTRVRQSRTNDPRGADRIGADQDQIIAGVVVGDRGVQTEHQ
jgi:small membrane protein